MPRCDVCGSSKWKQATVQEVFHIDGKPVLVENIPVRSCLRCGEATFSRETTERIRQIVHGETEAVRSISMAVISYA